MVRAVLFDLDGTLHDRASSVRLLFEAQYTQFESELPGVSREQYVRRALELDNHGYRDKREVFQRAHDRARLEARARFGHFPKLSASWLPYAIEA